MLSSLAESSICPSIWGILSFEATEAVLNDDSTEAVNVEVGVITGLAGAALGRGVTGLAGLAMAAWWRAARSLFLSLSEGPR